MFIGAGVFFYMGATRKVNTTMHTVIFFVCAVTAWYADALGFLQQVSCLWACFILLAVSISLC